VAQRAAQFLQQDITTLKIITCHLGMAPVLQRLIVGNRWIPVWDFTPLEGLSHGPDPAILILQLSICHGQRRDFHWRNRCHVK